MRDDAHTRLMCVILNVAGSFPGKSFDATFHSHIVHYIIVQNRETRGGIDFY